LGVPLPLILATITGVLTIIPFFGPLIAAIPILLIALATSPMTALYTLIFFVGLQVLEGEFITPMVQRKVVELPPFLLLTGQLVLTGLFVFFGLLLAAPLITLVMVTVKMLYLRDVLGEEVSLPGNG
jgi:predicted PurR-regulated permease PerM